MYATPRIVTDSGACAWYHTLDLPEIGTTPGSWDLRATIDDYLGRVDFAAKRCLDIGCGSGHLSFAMEQRGASEVVSVDVASGDQVELVPFADPRFDAGRRRRETVEMAAALHNGYWLAHRLLGSRARVWYGTAYELPAELGRFDVAVIGMMLPHVRDPLRVLERVAPLADTIVITQPAPGIPDAYAYFMPDPVGLNPDWAWWSMSEACLDRMLGIVGFTIERKIRAEHACPGRRDRHLPGSYRSHTEPCTTTVATRRWPRSNTSKLG